MQSYRLDVVNLTGFAFTTDAERPDTMAVNTDPQGVKK